MSTKKYKKYKQRINQTWFVYPAIVANNKVNNHRQNNISVISPRRCS